MVKLPILEIVQYTPCFLNNMAIDPPITDNGEEYVSNQFKSYPSQNVMFHRLTGSMSRHGNHFAILSLYFHFSKKEKSTLIQFIFFNFLYHINHFFITIQKKNYIFFSPLFHTNYFYFILHQTLLLLFKNKNHFKKYLPNTPIVSRTITEVEYRYTVYSSCY
jgi:hypothetical protein